MIKGRSGRNTAAEGGSGRKSEEIRGKRGEEEEAWLEVAMVAGHEPTCAALSPGTFKFSPLPAIFP